MAIKKLHQLTAARVATAAEGWHSDGGGLYLRVDKWRRWVFRYSAGGKRKEIGLGSADAVSLSAARAEAKKYRDIIASGRDPLALRRLAEVEAASKKTFAEAAHFVINRDKGGWVSGSLASWERSAFVHAKWLGPLDVNEIAIEHVKQVMAPIWGRGEHVAARKTLGRIEAVLACSIAHGWRSRANVAAWSVFKHISPKRRKDESDRHHPMVPWRDAPAVVERLREIDTFAARAVEFAALTAVRISEATKATWSEIDFDEATWMIPKGRMKMREPHVVPLSRQALALLADLAKTRMGKFVFIGRVDGKPISRMQCWNVCTTVTHGAGSPHGWRSTFRSWCADHGVDREAAESALAHTIGGVEGAYNRAAMVDRRRPIMQAWADHCDSKGAGATVIPFADKRR
jgi:integrase